jgi:predicted DNA-binding protein
MGRPARKYVKRVQMMLTEQQYELLQEYAQEIDKPLGVVIRETVEHSLIIDLEQRRKQKALERLCSGDTPVSDWPEMERQIEQRWEECWHE